jgi:hypothetical protein
MEHKHQALFSEGELSKSSHNLKATKKNPRPDSLDYDPAVAERLSMCVYVMSCLAN